MGAARDLDITEEDGIWLVRVIAPSDELSVQEYRCASQAVAAAFAAHLLVAVDHRARTERLLAGYIGRRRRVAVDPALH